MASRMMSRQRLGSSGQTTGPGAGQCGAATSAQCGSRRACPRWPRAAPFTPPRQLHAGLPALAVVLPVPARSGSDSRGCRRHQHSSWPRYRISATFSSRSVEPRSRGRASAARRSPPRPAARPFTSSTSAVLAKNAIDRDAHPAPRGVSRRQQAADQTTTAIPARLKAACWMNSGYGGRPAPCSCRPWWLPPAAAMSSASVSSSRDSQRPSFSTRSSVCAGAGAEMMRTDTPLSLSTQRSTPVAHCRAIEDQ